jgi:hypothetical protein
MNKNYNSQNKLPRLLVISHNCFSDVKNNGKTLASFLEDWDKQLLAQLYFHDENPSSNICSNYFKITESLIIKSIFFGQKCGLEIKENTFINSIKNSNRLSSIIYSFGSRKYWTLNILRDLFWALTKKKWNNLKLSEWIEKFSPQCIFLAAGDSAFIYKIAHEIASILNIPIIIFSGDNYLIYYKTLSIPVLIQQFILRRQARKVFLLTKKVITGSAELAEGYKKFFEVDAEVLLTGTKLNKSCNESMQFNNSKNVKFLYLGQLGLNRWKSLTDIGNSIRQYNELYNTNHNIDIFTTNSISKKVRKIFNNTSTINIKGSLTAKEVENIYQKYDILMHVEDKKYSLRTKYSMSTKIPEYLASGKIIFVYGPTGLASINYLQRNNAAFIVNDPSDIFKTLVNLMDNGPQRVIVSRNAIALANKNHNPLIIKETFKEIILHKLSTTVK